MEQFKSGGSDVYYPNDKFVDQFLNVTKESPCKLPLTFDELQIRQESVVREVARISMNIRRLGDHHTIGVREVSDFISGAGRIVHYLSEEAAGELSRDLVPILESDSFAILTDRILELSVVAAKVLQCHVAETEVAAGDAILGKYRDSVSFLRRRLENRIRDYQRDSVYHFHGHDSGLQASKVTAIAVHVLGRNLSYSPEKTFSSAFTNACNFLANGYIATRPKVLLVLGAMFNSVAQAYQYDPFCDVARVNREYFLKSFKNVRKREDPYACRFSDEQVDFVVKLMCDYMSNDSLLGSRREVTSFNDGLTMIFRWETQDMKVPELHSLLDSFKSPIV